MCMSCISMTRPYMGVTLVIMYENQNEFLKKLLMKMLQNLPKNGIRKAAQTVDATSVVLRRIKHQ